MEDGNSTLTPPNPESTPTVVFAENFSSNGSVKTTENSCEGVAKDELTEPQISKRKLRKLEKLRLWEATKQMRKENRRKKKQEQKEKRKQHLEKLKEEAIKDGLDPSEIIGKTATRKKLKSNSMKNSSCKVGVCIDMSFTDLMTDKDLHHCIKQISRCYSANRRFTNPLQFHVTSFCEKSKSVMEKHDGWRNWDMYVHEKSYLELDDYPKDKIVYLTAESENVLKEPENDVLYVIGGLVDHNSRKGLCHKLAVEKGVAHARLPLGEYIEMNRRKVLSILHVFEIVGNVAQKRPWQEVLMEVLPSRTHARLKQHSSDDEESFSEDDEDIEDAARKGAVASQEQIHSEESQQMQESNQ